MSVKSATKKIEWIITDKYMIGNKCDLKGKKLAAFDLDHTLIKPINNKKFSETDSDWELYDNCLVEKLNKLVSTGYTLVIISNQKGISTGKVSSDVFQSKMKKISDSFNQDFIIFISLEDDLYRKPRTKLWDEFIMGDISTSFYCGDAAGLAGDFSDSDLKFALNVGVKFMYRDEFLLNKPIKCVPEYPIKFNEIINVKSNYQFVPNQNEVIINVGLPGSGKSFFTKKYVVPQGYENINQDILKTKAKCLKMYENFLVNNKSVVIDNTNLSKEQRKVYLDLAKAHNVKCRCIHFTTVRDICIHNSYYRNYITNGSTKPIPNMVYNMMNKKFQSPDISEGFYQIDKVNFSVELPEQKDIDLYKKFFY